MKLLDARTARDTLKLSVFMAITALCTALLAVTIGNISFADSRTYRAVFLDATGVVKGDDIRVAGVKVGNVEDVEIFDRDKAVVTFKVATETAVTEGTIVTIRYRNLVGQRYLALSQGDGDGGVLAEDATIPIDRTRPALDLTVLFNGFKPLFAALSPADINKLAFELIRVFQGEGGTVESLLGHTAAVTNTLADRDEVVGELITNLNQTLVTLGDRDEQLSSLLVNLRRFVGGLTRDRQAILGSLETISALSVETADLVAGIRPAFTEDVRQLRRVTDVLNRNRGELDRAIKVLPIKLRKIGRTATYGSWFNFYLCSFNATVRVPGGTPAPISYDVANQRCRL